MRTIHLLQCRDLHSLHQLWWGLVKTHLPYMDVERYRNGMSSAAFVPRITRAPGGRGGGVTLRTTLLLTTSLPWWLGRLYGGTSSQVLLSSSCCGTKWLHHTMKQHQINNFQNKSCSYFKMTLCTRQTGNSPCEKLNHSTNSRTRIHPRHMSTASATFDQSFQYLTRRSAAWQMISWFWASFCRITLVVNKI